MKTMVKRVDAYTRINIPKQIKDAIKLRPGDLVEFSTKEDTIIIKKIKSKEDFINEESKKKYFKIPVEWSSAGVVQIKARTLEEAVKRFDGMKDKINHVYDTEMIYGTLDRIKSTGDNIEYYRAMQKFW